LHCLPNHLIRPEQHLRRNGQADLLGVLIDKPWLQVTQKNLRDEAREDR